MDYIITGHARVQMALRRVTEAEIEFVLQNYSMAYPADDGGTTLFALLGDGTSVRLWVVGGLPLEEPVIIKSLVGRG